MPFPHDFSHAYTCGFLPSGNRQNRLQTVIEYEIEYEYNFSNLWNKCDGIFPAWWMNENDVLF